MAERSELEEMIKTLWMKTVQAREATDKGLEGRGEAVPGMNRDALTKLAEILEMHPELFEETEDSGIYHRSMAWVDNKNRKVRHLKATLEHEEITPCKDTPTIDHNSQATVEKLLEEGSWPEVVTRMTIHHQAQMERKAKTEAWKTMHSLLSDTQPHAPQISSKAASLSRSGAIEDRLYALKDAQKKSKRLYPYTPPDSSWTAEEIDAYLKDYPDQAPVIKKIAPGGFLSPQSRHLSESYAARSGMTHKDRLTAAKKPPPAVPEKKQEPTINKKSMKLAEEWRKSHGNQGFFKRLSVPATAPIQPPPLKGIPGINKVTSVDGGSLGARVSKPVHERLFNDHELYKKHKEGLKEKVQAMQDTPRKKAYQQLQEHIQGYEAVADVFNRNKHWASAVMAKRERARSEQREKEVAYPFKPTLTPYKPPGGHRSPKGVQTPVDGRAIRTPPTVPTEVDMEKSEEREREGEGIEGELYSSEKPNRIVRSVSPQPQRLFEEEVYTEHLPEKNDPPTTHSSISDLHNMLSKYIEERAASLSSLSTPSTRDSRSPEVAISEDNDEGSPQESIPITAKSPPNIIHPTDVVAAAAFHSEKEVEKRTQPHVVVSGSEVVPAQPAPLRTYEVTSPRGIDRYTADYYEPVVSPSHVKSQTPMTAASAASYPRTPAPTPEAVVITATQREQYKVAIPTPSATPPHKDLISIIDRDGLPTTPMRSIGGDGPLLNSIAAPVLVKVESVLRNTHQTIIKRSSPVRGEGTPPRRVPLVNRKPAVPRQSVSPKRSGSPVKTYAAMGNVQQKPTRISPMTLKPWREPVRVTKKIMEEKKRRPGGGLPIEADEFIPAEEFLVKEKEVEKARVMQKGDEIVLDTKMRRERDSTPVNECYVGKDGVVRLLKMGMRKKLLEAPKNADEKYKAMVQHKRTEEVFNVKRTEPDPDKVVTTSLDLKGDEGEYCRVADEERGEVSKALLSLGKERVEGKRKSPPKKRVITIPIEYDVSMSSDDPGPEGYMIDPANLDPLTSNHFPEELEAALRQGSVARATLDTYLSPTAVSPRPPSPPPTINPEWVEKEDTSHDLAELLEDEPSTPSHHGRPGLPFVLNVVSPIKH